MQFRIKRSKLFCVLSKYKLSTMYQRKHDLYCYIQEYFQFNNTSENKKCVLEALRISFLNNLRKKRNELRKNLRDAGNFRQKYSDWLDGDFTFYLNERDADDLRVEDLKEKVKVGRPSIDHELASTSVCTKKRKLETIAGQLSFESAMKIAKMKMKEVDCREGMVLLDRMKDFGSASQNSLYIDNQAAPQLSPDEALSALVDAGLTKHAYKTLRKRSNKKNHRVFPAYHKVQREKESAYPKNIKITESECDVPLQDLTDHTMGRLLKSLNIKLPRRNARLKMIWKDGLDGTKAPNFKQSSENNAKTTDDIFCICLVPLQLVDEKNGTIYWQNRFPNSPRYCRIKKMVFKKETPELTKIEFGKLEKEKSELKGFKWGNCTIAHNILSTMIDGKVKNTLTETSSQACYLCGEKISDLHRIELIERDIPMSRLKFGFSVLHTFIRTMEYVWNISCRPFKHWRVTTEDDKQAKKKKKEEMQEAFRKDLGILIDFPTTGSGNTNDGNTARKFFDNIDTVARITGFDYELLRRFKTILTVISSKHETDVPKFKDYCRKTAERCKELYGWYRLPPSLHIVLMHGYRVLSIFFLPMGILSEEAIESNHKIVKSFKSKFTRKTSRIATNEDLFHRLFLYSDPLLTDARDVIEKDHKRYTLEEESLMIIRREAADSSLSEGGSSSEDCDKED